MVCCATGHRALPSSSMERIKEELVQRIEEAVNDGYTIFYSGGADGSDIMFAEAVLSLKKRYPQIELYMAIPYRARYASLMANKATRPVIEGSGRVIVLSEGYSIASFHKRNRYMVEQSSRVIAVYDGRTSGGTYSTLKRARKAGKEIIIINP